jgi:hypothetical protein
MGDLEEMILKENVPGRWSRFRSDEKIEREDVSIDEGRYYTENNGVEEDEYDDQNNGRRLKDEEEREQTELFELARSMDRDDVPEPVRMRILSEREKKHATGVKGVLADYQAAMALEQAHQAVEAANRAAIIKRMVEGSKRPAVSVFKVTIRREKIKEDTSIFVFTLFL